MFASKQSKASEPQRLIPGHKTSFILFTGVPAILALVYLFFLAQPAYQAEVKLIVRENKEASSSIIPGLAASLLGTGFRTSVEDAYILMAYLHGSEFIELADRRLGLKAHYQSPAFDPLYSLESAPLAEEFYEYFRKRIVIKIAPESSIVSIQTKAFSPEMAEALAKLVIEESERAINTLNLRMVDAKTALAKKELEESQGNLIAKRKEMLRFQTEHAMVNPASEVTSHLSNVAGLDAKLVEKRTELRAKEQYLRPEAFEVRTLQQQISALDSQRQQETGNLVGAGDKSVAATLQGYEDLRMQAEFALQAYTSAFALAESAKLEAGKQEKFLLLIAPPRPPEEPVFPNPLKGVLTVFVCSVVLFGIGRLVISTIRDHSI